MRRWRVFSARDVHAWPGLILWPAGIAVGLLSERARFGWDDFSRWIPDLAVGLVFVGCGVQAMARNRGTAVLLAGVGFAWFLANFWADALFVHRGLLVQLLVTYPGWRPRGRIDAVAVVLGYVAAIWIPVWRNEVATVVLACGVVAVVARGFLLSHGLLRRVRRTALVAAVLFGAVLVAGVAMRSTVGADALNAERLLYQVALCGVAFVLTVGLPARDASSVVDLVVELGETRSGTLRDALATTLGDPTLELGYWTQDGTYRDVEGRLVVVPPVGSARSATNVERDSQPFAVLVHDPAVLGEPALVEAVAAATRLSTANAELQAVVREQLAELSASRRRLVSAADEERRRLDDRLRDEAERTLRDLDDVLRSVRCERADLERVRRALDLLTQTIEDLRELAMGLHPRELDRGLGPALQSLAGRSPVPVELSVNDVSIDPDTRTAVFYVCAEACSNVIKHAAATSVVIEVATTDESVLVEVSDDGVGGADTGRGTGLRGLIDRVEALDGTVRLDSPPGGGTRLIVDLPNLQSAGVPC